MSHAIATPDTTHTSNIHPDTKNGAAYTGRALLSGARMLAPMLPGKRRQGTTSMGIKREQVISRHGAAVIYRRLSHTLPRANVAELQKLPSDDASKNLDIVRAVMFLESGMVSAGTEL